MGQAETVMLINPESCLASSGLTRGPSRFIHFAGERGGGAQGRFKKRSKCRVDQIPPERRPTPMQASRTSGGSAQKMKVFPRLAACALALLLTASFISHSRSAPQGHFQRRNWTPQAMLYLKGAQGRRFISEESQRKDLYDNLELEKRSRNSNAIAISEAAAMFLSSLRKAQEEAEEESINQQGFLPEALLNW